MKKYDFLRKVTKGFQVGLLSCLSCSAFVSCNKDDSGKQILEFIMPVQVNEYLGTDTIVANVNVSAQISQEKRTITYVMPLDVKNIDSITPVIKLSSNATIKPDTNTPQDFDGKVVLYTVTAQDGSTSIYTASFTFAEKPEITNILPFYVKNDQTLTITGGNLKLEGFKTYVKFIDHGGYANDVVPATYVEATPNDDGTSITFKVPSNLPLRGYYVYVMARGYEIAVKGIADYYGEFDYIYVTDNVPNQ